MTMKNLGGMLPILFWYANKDDATPLCVEYFAAIEDSVTLRYILQLLITKTAFLPAIAINPS